MFEPTSDQTGASNVEERRGTSRGTAPTPGKAFMAAALVMLVLPVLALGGLVALTGAYRRASGAAGVSAMDVDRLWLGLSVGWLVTVVLVVLIVAARIVGRRARS